MELHHGQIVERVIRRNGYSISELARLTKVNRRSVYNWFNQKRLKPELIYRIGSVLNYDFSIEFPELFSTDEYEQFIASSSFTEQLNKQKDEPSDPAPPPALDVSVDQENPTYWKDKYIDLLERYNQFLIVCLEKRAQSAIPKEGM